jgi:predicted GIY-YIG superfamily endonuclease
MSIKFDTFGPLLLSRADQIVSVDELRTFSEALEGERKGLSKAIGVYIFGLKNSKGEITPWYVGKTDKGFSRRFDEHSRGKGENLFTKLAKEMPKGDLQVFLIARLTPSEKFMKPKKAKSKAGSQRHKITPVKSIDRLEFALIGTCLAKNPDLINRSQKTFHEDFHVPGYMEGNTPSKSTAARSLRRTLRAKKSK